MARRRRGTPKVPDGTFSEIVTGLHHDSRSTAIGNMTTSALVAAFGIYLDDAVLGCIGAICALTTLWRLRCMRRYAALEGGGASLSRTELRSWLVGYARNGYVFAAAVGAGAFWVQFLPNATAQIMLVALCIANVAGVVSRNYGFRRLVEIQIALLLLPVIAGIALQGTLGLVTALICLPGVLTFRAIADHLRGILIASVEARGRAERERRRLDAALATMPTGLMMFDANGRCSVANASATRYARMDAEAMIGLEPRSILHAMVREGAVDAATAAEMEAMIRSCEPPVAYLRFTVEARRTRTIEMIRSVAEDGACTAVFEDVTEKVEAAATIDRMSTRDRLTGALNRDQLSRAVRDANARCEGGHAAFLLIDIDHFDRINATHGRKAGDAVLLALSAHLRDAGGENAALLRLGGDKFGLLLATAPGARRSARSEAERIARELCGGVSGGWTQGTGRDDVSVTCGVAWGEIARGAARTASDVTVHPGMRAGDPRNGFADALPSRASMALDAARRDGGGGWVLYDDEIGERARRAHTLRKDLPKAIEKGALTIAYQPVANLQGGYFDGAEALVRWTHPRLGPVSPAEFVPIAEQEGLTPMIGRFVLEEAVRACATWPSHVSVAVNLSPRELMEPGLAERVCGVLARHGLAPQRLTLEITEGVAIENIEQTCSVLNAIRALGVRTALDDFGTGFSSLSYLQRLPLDRLKLDRSFVAGLDRPQGRALVRHVSALTHDLGLSLVVEGTETAKQLDLMKREATPTHVQGFLFGRPMEEQAFRECIEAMPPEELVRQAA